MMRKNTKSVIVVTGIAIAVILAFSGIAAYLQATKQNVRLEQQTIPRSLGDAYDQYGNPNPSYQEWPYYGDGSSSVTVITYNDFISESSKEYMNSTLSMMRDIYFNTGRTRYYQLPFVTPSDYVDNTTNYQFALLATCARQLNHTQYHQYLLAVYNTTTPTEALKKATEYGYDESAMAECTGTTPPELLQAIRDVERLGLIGVSPRIFIGIEGTDNTIITGIPSDAALQRSIRFLEIRIGQ